MDARGHRLDQHGSACVVEAWGPDRCACLAEAMAAVVDLFAEPVDDVAARTLPVSAEPGADADILVSLLEAVVSVIGVLGVVPVRFHVSETEDGGVAGDMEVVRAADAVLAGVVPKAVSHRGLEIAARDGGWTCRAVVETSAPA